MTSSAKKDAVLLETAVLEWSEAEEPASSLFADRYFSSSGGLSESRYVFLEQNDLANRFALLGPRDCFTVAETGFGTGLNFLATAQLWHTKSTQGWLHFVSFERYPLHQGDLARALDRWPELNAFAGRLLDQYPEAIRGVHRLVWPDLRIRLTLWFGDALDGLEALPFHAQAWFLDGFNPSSNASLWNDCLYGAVARHSTVGTTLSTFTVAGAVRRGLAAAGFDVAKVPGHKPKREMTRARLASGIARGDDAHEYGTHHNRARHNSAHHSVNGHKSACKTTPCDNNVFVSRSADNHDEQLPEQNHGNAAGTPGKVIIVGAGIAGCLLAANLADRGADVTLIEAGPGPAMGASGNPQGALYTKLAVDYTPQSQLALAALLFAQRFYTQAQLRINGHPFWHPTGLLQLATTPVEADRQQRFLARNRYPDSFLQSVTASEASAIAQLPLEHGGLFFPGSGWLSPTLLCHALCLHPGIHLLAHTSMRTFGADAAGHWVEIEADPQADNADANPTLPARPVQGSRSRLHGDQLILCPGASPLLTNLGLPMKPIRGQVSWWPPGALPTPECVICGDGYINPANEHQQTLGATFDLRDSSPEVRAADHQRNLEAVATWLHPLKKTSDATLTLAQGRTSFRCTTPDYQPLAGWVRPPEDTPSTAVPSGGESASRDVAVLSGLGSKGLAFAPLLAEWLSDIICGMPPALPDTLAQQVCPHRFQQRANRRQAGAQLR